MTAGGILLRMSYSIGTHIDLSHLNMVADSSNTQKKSFQEAVDNAYDVGTEIIFKLSSQGFKAARRIPVSFA